MAGRSSTLDLACSRQISEIAQLLHSADGFLFEDEKTMRNMLNILADPTAVFREISSRPRWATATLFATTAFFVLSWLGGCWKGLSQGLHWSSLLGPALISPLIVSIVFVGTATFLYLAVLVVGGRGGQATNFRTLFSMTAHCGIVFLLGEVVNFLLVRTPLVGDHAPPLPGRFPVGLDLLLIGIDEPNLYLAIILHGTSIFWVWYLVVLSIGIREVAGLSRARAGILAVAVWGAAIGLVLGVVYALGGDTAIRIRI